MVCKEMGKDDFLPHLRNRHGIVDLEQRRRVLVDTLAGRGLQRGATVNKVLRVFFRSSMSLAFKPVNPTVYEVSTLLMQEE